MMESFDGMDSYQDFSKKDLHSAINGILMDKYAGEAQLKYKLAHFFRKQKYQAGFEIKTNNARADFLAINGHTKCFEIKSERDNLSRLKSQLDSYAQIFEYIYIVGDRGNEKQLLELNYSRAGIWIFDGKKKIEIKPSELSTSIDPKKQLSILTKKELQTTYKYNAAYDVLNKYDAIEINEKFKAALKNRYAKRWSFVQQRWDCILPFDLQFFFNQNVDPNLIYSV